MRLNCKIGLPAAVRAIDRAVGVVPPDPPVLHPNEIERLLAEQGGWHDAADAPVKVTTSLSSLLASSIT
jgi:hypothetical protein